MIGQRPIEPFAVGQSAEIGNADVARKVLIDNSYYFLLAGFVLLFLPVLALLAYGNVPKDVFMQTTVSGTFYILIGYFLRIARCRVAAVCALILSGAGFLYNIIFYHVTLATIFLIILVAASIRSIRACSMLKASK